MRIDFLHQNIYGVGGTVRSVVNLANALAARHDVRIVTVFRRVDRPTLRVDPRVRLVPLVDLRPNGADRGDARHNKRSTLVPPAEEYFRQYSELTDQRITAYLSSAQCDVVVGTRPSLNLLIAEHGPEGVLRVTQEHMSHTAIPESVVARMRRAYPSVDVVTTVTEADRRRVERSLGLRPGRSAVLPNPVPAPRTGPAQKGATTIVAAGRLAPEKRYDVLLRAFAILSPDFPQWRLRLYGDGPLAAPLASLAADLGIRDSVLFMGKTADMESQWVKGSLSVSSSERESFGMSIVESMRAGVAVVSTDCPDGPREIIRHGQDGLLVPVGDERALADALRPLLSSPQRVAQLGAAARRSSRRYDPVRVAADFEGLLIRAGAGRGPRRGIRSRLRAQARAWRAARRPRSLAAVEVVAVDASRLRITSSEVGRALRHATLHRAGTVVAARELRARRVRRGVEIDTSALPEGLWNLQLHRGRTRVALTPASVDTRALVRSADLDPHRFHWMIPYRNMHDRVGVRIWDRTRHIEVVRVRVEGDDFHVEVRPLGAWASGPVSWTLLRGAQRTAVGGTLIDGTARIPAADVAALRRLRNEVFTLVALDGEQAVPFALLATDIADARRIVRLPGVLVAEDPPHEDFHDSGFRGTVEVRGEVGPGNAVVLRVREGV